MSWLSELNWSNRLEHLYAMIAGEAELDETVPSTYDRKQGFLYKIAQKIAELSEGGGSSDINYEYDFEVNVTLNTVGNVSKQELDALEGTSDKTDAEVRLVEGYIKLNVFTPDGNKVCEFPAICSYAACGPNQGTRLFTQEPHIKGYRFESDNAMFGACFYVFHISGDSVTIAQAEASWEAFLK